MNNRKKLGIISTGLMVIGAAISLLSSSVSDRIQEEMINEAVEKRFNSYKENNTEEES